MQTVTAAGLPIGDDHPPRIMGVLNVSRESPYDPSVYADPGAAAAYVDDALIDEGADIVDVGLESANKRFEVLSPEAELDRLDTALEAVESVSGDAVFCIETRYHEVAAEALSRGFDMVNDICGFADPEMPRVCEAYDAAVVKMASPPDLERPGAIEDVDDIYAGLQREGLTEKTIVDPAFGGWSDAKTLADDRETFHRLEEFRGLDRPILVSINRKNFLRDIADRSTEEALPVSLAATALAVERGVHVIRTHDVGATRDAALVGHEFTGSRFRNRVVGIEELAVSTVTEVVRHRDRLATVSPAGETTEIGRPAAGVSRAFLLSGLGHEGRDELAGLAGEHDAYLYGASDRLLLAGSVGALRDLTADRDANTAAQAHLRALSEALR